MAGSSSRTTSCAVASRTRCWRSAGSGIETARPSPEVLAAIAAAELIVVAPSNPFVSVGTILAVPGMLGGAHGSRGTESWR